MSFWLLNRLILLTILLCASVVSLIQFKKLDKASRYIAVLISFTFLVESLALWAAYEFQQNNPIYNTANIIEFVLLTLYFNNSISSFKKRNVGYKIAAAGIIVALFNLFFIQDIFILNTNFLAVESLSIVGMCLYYFYDFLRGDTYLEKLPPQFWATSLLLIFWSFTLFHWLVGFYIMYTNSYVADWPYHIIMVVNALTYLSFGILFFNYRKMSQVD